MEGPTLATLLRAFAALDAVTQAQVLVGLEHPILWGGGKPANKFLNLVNACGVYVEVAP